jgi:hypothetical protein
MFRREEGQGYMDFILYKSTTFPLEKSGSPKRLFQNGARVRCFPQFCGDPIPFVRASKTNKREILVTVSYLE